MKYELISLKKASDNVHKYIVDIIDNNNKHYYVKFGAKGYSDFTKNHDNDRKERYILRHKSKEDWTNTGILSAGFWSRWILWNKATVHDSVIDVVKRFKL